MKIPTLTRKSISRAKLIQSLPVDKWISVRNCDLDMTPHSFNQSMKGLPAEFVDRKRENNMIKFKIHSRKYAALIKLVTSGYIKPVKQKITKHKLSREDELHNLFMLA